MPVESVYARLEPLLPLVRKPVQYVGGELNAVVKDWDAADVRWALMYPDAYEVGVANQGIQILYEVLNGCDGVLAERTYSVWPDLEDLLRERGIGQFTVDGHRPVRAFDVLGVSFATELGYTNLLTALDLAGIPLSAARRGEEDPLVIAGGHAAFNPEPVAEFLDGAGLGGGEQAGPGPNRANRDLGRGRGPRARARRQRVRRGRPVVAVQRRPQRDQRDRHRPGRPLHRHQHRALPAVHPGGRLQRHPRQRTEPERPPVRAHLRPRGRLGADAQ